MKGTIKWKRILALMCAVALMVSTMPSPVQAVEDISEKTPVVEEVHE